MALCQYVESNNNNAYYYQYERRRILLNSTVRNNKACVAGVIIIQIYTLRDKRNATQVQFGKILNLNNSNKNICISLHNQ